MNEGVTGWRLWEPPLLTSARLTVAPAVEGAGPLLHLFLSRPVPGPADTWPPSWGRCLSVLPLWLPIRASSCFSLSSLLLSTIKDATSPSSWAPLALLLKYFLCSHLMKNRELHTWDWSTHPVPLLWGFNPRCLVSVLSPRKDAGEMFLGKILGLTSLSMWLSQVKRWSTPKMPKGKSFEVTKVSWDWQAESRPGTVGQLGFFTRNKFCHINYLMITSR